MPIGDATDKAGNVSAGPTALTVTIDTAAPSVPGFTTVSTSAVTNFAAAKLVATLLDGATTLGAAATGASGMWKPATPTAIGLPALTAKATDVASNDILARGRSGGGLIGGMAPGMTYPEHNHPPEAIHLVLLGGEWWQAGGTWHAPGPEGIGHAMRGTSVPLLAIWFLLPG